MIKARRRSKFVGDLEIGKSISRNYAPLMTADEFLVKLQGHAETFAKAVATKEGEWIIKGFIDIYRRIYTVSVDTKIISKVLELLLLPMFDEFAVRNKLRLELCPQQNFYPDLTFIDESAGAKFAVDIKSTYRISSTEVNGMTLGAFTGYFRQRESNKNTLYPYSAYAGHFVLGVIYSKSDTVVDERLTFKLDDLEKIPSVVKDFVFFAQPKYKIAGDQPGSGNTRNIGSIRNLQKLIRGDGPFASLGEEIYDDYWMFYLTLDMAAKLEVPRPYRSLKTYADYKEKGVDQLQSRKDEIAKLEEPPAEQEHTE